MDNELLLLAQNSKEFIMGVLVPLVVLWLTKLEWKAQYKFFAAAGVSLAAALLTSYADGKLTFTSVATDLTVIFTTAQFVYNTFFKALGLEAWLVPQTAVVDQATQVVKDELSDLTREEAVKVLDKTTPQSVVVNVSKT